MYHYRISKYLSAKGMNPWFKFNPELEDRFIFRVKNANIECLGKGKCIHCGCDVPELFMSDKGCEINCYKEK
jgi:hypothetical protein